MVPAHTTKLTGYYFDGTKPHGYFQVEIDGHHSLEVLAPINPDLTLTVDGEAMIAAAVMRVVSGHS